MKKIARCQAEKIKQAAGLMLRYRTLVKERPARPVIDCKPCMVRG